MAHCWDNVKVEIGALRYLKTHAGSNAKEATPGVDREEFKDCLTITTLARPPRNMIRTDHGDLILAHEYAGRVFLRGLEPPASSASGKSFGYGYDLLEGNIGRDRTSLSKASEEARLTAKSWSAALSKTHSTEQGELLMAKYVSMIEENASADVHDVNKYLLEPAVHQIWQHLVQKAQAQAPQGFYYCPEFAQDDHRIITRYLQLTPIPLARNTYDTLRKYDFCRSAQEERELKFQNLPALAEEDLSSFGGHVLRLLKAGLLSHACTANKQVIIVDGGALDVKTFYDITTQSWKVERKLFDMQTSHRHVHYCEALNGHSGNGDAAKHICWCHNAVVDIYRAMIFDLGHEGLGVRAEREAVELREQLISMVHHICASVPQNLQISPGKVVGSLLVTWESPASRMAAKHSNTTYMITIHSVEYCVEKALHVLHKSDIPPLCDCPVFEVPLRKHSHLITDVDQGRLYYATIRLNSNVAIYNVSSNDSLPSEVQEIANQEVGTGDELEDFEILRDLEYNSASLRSVSEEMDADDSFETRLHDGEGSPARHSEAAGGRRLTGHHRTNAIPIHPPLTLSSAYSRASSVAPIPTSPSLQNIIAQCDELATDNLCQGMIARRDWHQGRDGGRLDGVIIGVPKVRPTDGHGSRQPSASPPSRRPRLV